MTAWGLVSIASLVATGAVAAYVFLGRPRTVSTLPFGLLMLSFAMWNLGDGLASLAGAPDPGLMPLIRLEWVGISLTSGAFLHFVLNFSSGRPLRDRPWLVPLVYAVSAVIGALVVSTDLIVSGVELGPNGPSERLGPGYPAGAVWYEAWFAFTLVALLRAYVGSGSKELRRRTRPVIVVLAVAVVVGSVTEVLWPVMTASPTGLEVGPLYTFAIAVVAAFSEARLRFLEVQAVTERTRTASRFRLRPGLSYLFLSRERDPAYEAFRGFVDTVPGLCITAVHPPKVQERFRLERTPILWVTSVSGADFSLRPKALEFELYHSAARFVRGNPSVVVLVDDLDFLVLTNGFEAVARFLHRLNNLATGRGSTVIAATDPDALTEAQRTLLEGLFDEVQESPPAISLFEPAPPRDAGAVLFEGDPEAAFSLYESRAVDGRGLLVTTKNPLRLRRVVDPEVPILWIGGPREGSDNDGPFAIDLEAGKIAADLMRERTRPVVYLADLEQLRLHAPFPRVAEFVKGLIDNVSLRGGVFLASVEPKAVAPTELASLRRRFDRVRAPWSFSPPWPVGPPRASPGNRIRPRRRAS
ncbi:MAG TPA: DUF835 domain-containing protein [Thermoplasmata archaeon]|nr:DUF835 domain-containing protein [Thermoplasmata archaeon]